MFPKHVLQHRHRLERMEFTELRAYYVSELVNPRYDIAGVVKNDPVHWSVVICRFWTGRKFRETTRQKLVVVESLSESEQIDEHGRRIFGNRMNSFLRQF
ncbi:hypothetical protein Tcan_06857 [Toxocara canis]|uniref:Uncharacterized protein n=1 Tax=Toxocara canis TaxID=6265 RepID=A0A0B2VVJ6_TOXCA|nr:hypothetical protein Tcan_06857 [Toxocara canis]